MKQDRAEVMTSMQSALFRKPSATGTVSGTRRSPQPLEGGGTGSRRWRMGRRLTVKIYMRGVEALVCTLFFENDSQIQFPTSHNQQSYSKTSRFQVMRAKCVCNRIFVWMTISQSIRIITKNIKTKVCTLYEKRRKQLSNKNPLNLIKI